MSSPYFAPLHKVWADVDYGPDIGIPLVRRVNDVLLGWEGTPYHEAMCERGRGVSCVGFLARVFEELCSMEPEEVPALPSHVASKGGKESFAVMRYFLRRFPHYHVFGDEELQPADVIVCGKGGPAHAMIVGPRKNTIWHAGASGVHYTGWTLPPKMTLHAVYRLKNREDWI